MHSPLRKHYIIKKIDLFNLSIKNTLVSLAGVGNVQICNYLGNENISYEYKNSYVEVKEKTIYYYWQGSLCYQCNADFSDCQATYFLKVMLKDDSKIKLFVNEANVEVTSGLSLIYNIETNKINAKISSREFGKYYKVKDLSAELYEFTHQSIPYIVKEKENKIKILLNKMYRKSYTIPTREYPLPESKAYTVFYRGKSPQIHDNGELDTILKGYHGELGKCFKNTEIVIQKLQEANYDSKHSINYFAGWLFLELGEPIFHAWAVIDGISVVDVGIFNDLTNNEYLFEDKIINGEIDNKRETLAKNIKKISNDKESLYSKYYNYGDCGKYLYVGALTTRENAAAIFKKILESSHKSYDNVDKQTGENKLQKIYKKI